MSPTWGSMWRRTDSPSVAKGHVLRLQREIFPHRNSKSSPAFPNNVHLLNLTSLSGIPSASSASRLGPRCSCQFFLDICEIRSSHGRLLTVTSCSLVGSYKCFCRTCCLHFQGWMSEATGSSGTLINNSWDLCIVTSKKPVMYTL
jgi:hypothetical protein